MATCEIYVRGQEELGVDDEAAVMALEAEVAGAERAGLKVQAKQASAEVALRRLGLKPLSGQEFNIWRRWFPTAYRQSYYYCECGRVMVTTDGFTNYRFDRVPTSMLEFIQRCRDEFKLDWLEIRTPEKQRIQDPGLFGGKGQLTVLLGRWRESDDRLITLEEIKRGLKARDQPLLASSLQIIAGFMSSFVALYCAIIAIGPGPEVSNPILLMVGPSVSVAVGIGAISYLGVWKRRLRRAFAYAFA